MRSQQSDKDFADKAHWIKPVKHIKMPGRVLFFDVETETINNRGTQNMILCVSVYCKYPRPKKNYNPQWFSTSIPQEFYLYIMSLVHTQSVLTIMSANIWFDIRCSELLYWLGQAGFKCRYVYISSHTFIARFFKDKRQIDFVNIQNYFNMSVKEIGRSIGMDKLDIDFFDVTPGKLYEYCKRDVEIIQQAFTDYVDFIQKDKLGTLGYTIASTAYNVYRKSFMSTWIHVHKDKAVTEIEREAYYGGRCECFRLGDYANGPYFKLDVNSMYPYVMWEYNYPYRLYKQGVNIDPKIIGVIKNKYSYIAHVKLQTDDPVYPYRTKEKLIFPIGTFETVLTTPSINHAYRQGHLQKIYNILVYKHKPLFKSYMDFFYKKRLRYKQHDNTAFVYLCKLLMTNLYGKFGQRLSELIYETQTDKEDNYREMIYDDVDKKFYIKQRFFGLESLHCLQQIEAANAVPFIPAHVTDYARLYLWDLCRLAGTGNIFYIDTDSLIVNTKGYHNLNPYLDDTKLGHLKLEGQSDTISIYGLKNYIFNGVHKIKGIPIKHVKLNDFTYEYTFFPGVYSELKHGLEKEYRIYTVKKSISNEYDKGIVDTSGKITPIVLP